MGDILAGVRETFETAHKVLLACDKTMEAFGAFLRRIRLPREYDGGAVPLECETPDALVWELKELHSLFEQLEICYLYDPASKADILRALSSRPVVPVPAMLNVTAKTHVEAAHLVASQIYWPLQRIGDMIWNASYDALEFKPGFASECEQRANQVRDYMRNGQLSSNSLDYLRRAVVVEDEICREYFNPSALIASVTVTPAVPSSGVKAVPMSSDDPSLPDWLSDELTQDKLLEQCAKLKALWPLPENGGVFRESQKIRELKAGLAKLDIDTPAGLPVLRDNFIERLKNWSTAKNLTLFDDFHASVDLIATAIKNSQSAVPKEVPAIPNGEVKQVEHECYVTLDSLANYLRVNKKTMERRYADGKLCEPDIEGGGGKAHQWKYSRIRPFLETEFARQLPERWPGEQFAFR